MRQIGRSRGIRNVDKKRWNAGKVVQRWQMGNRRFIGLSVIRNSGQTLESAAVRE